MKSPGHRMALAVAVMGLAAGVAGAASPPASAASGPELTVELRCAEAPRCASGRFAVAVFREGGGFPRQDEAIASRLVRSQGAVTQTVFADLPPGRYAIAAYHDADDDGRLTTWAMGLPREAYGFSNNARGRFGPPSFESAAFTLGAGGARQTLTLR
ncbi:MAG TPA: DUF2141 domain-containing protein [Brevundimonas sp.]|uniref:DUF2141 domain-containing protein n=1 Tax=Brevundimonas sp. TaxID=1871086 RepID=UPI002E132222|nr:DUF2141 domain-containing protein [Brevundimonas sp.]